MGRRLHEALASLESCYCLRKTYDRYSWIARYRRCWKRADVSLSAARAIEDCSGAYIRALECRGELPAAAGEFEHCDAYQSDPMGSKEGECRQGEDEGAPESYAEQALTTANLASMLHVIELSSRLYKQQNIQQLGLHVQFSMVKSEDDENIATINRFNITLARSSRVLQGWVSQKSAPQDETEDDAFDEREFRSETEKGGVASKTAYAEDDTLPDGSFQRKKLASNDALAERLLGQQVANARKKSQVQGKAMSSSKHAAPKPITNRPKVLREADSDDEGEGRAAAFTSKQQRKASTTPVDAVKEDDKPMDDEVSDEQPTSRQAATTRPDPAVAMDEVPQPTKRKATSYLDELLAQKAKKKSKKKKKDKARSTD